MINQITDFIERVVEGSDPELNEHLQRMGHTAALFARAIGLTQEETHILVIGTRLHDIGKLSINSQILNKPGRLTTSEFSMVKQHSDIGQKLLAPLGVDRRIAEIVHYHHENYDGTGYPEGKANTNIPLLARITRILDSYDAITSDRPYQKGVSNDEALKILKNDAQFYDPGLLESFCSLKSGHDQHSGTARTTAAGTGA